MYNQLLMLFSIIAEKCYDGPLEIEHSFNKDGSSKFVFTLNKNPLNSVAIKSVDNESEFNEAFSEVMTLFE